MTKNGNANPRRRTEHLITEEVAGEVLIYKLDEHKALRLNGTASNIWRKCDGKRSIAHIAKELVAETGEPVKQELVEYTVGRLAKAGLLHTDTATIVSSVSRRELVGRLGVAATALPVIFALVAPRAFAQGSLCAPNGACGTGAYGCGTPCLNMDVDMVPDTTCDQVCDKRNKLDMDGKPTGEIQWRCGAYAVIESLCP